MKTKKTSAAEKVVMFLPVAVLLAGGLFGRGVTVSATQLVKPAIAAPIVVALLDRGRDR